MILKSSAWKNGQESLQMCSLTSLQIGRLIFARGVCTKYYTRGDQLIMEPVFLWKYMFSLKKNVRTLIYMISLIKHTTVYMLENKAYVNNCILF